MGVSMYTFYSNYLSVCVLDICKGTASNDMTIAMITARFFSEIYYYSLKQKKGYKRYGFPKNVCIFSMFFRSKDNNHIILYWHA